VNDQVLRPAIVTRASENTSSRPDRFDRRRFGDVSV
jgi:hypothetical protein